MAIVININAKDGATPALKNVVKEIGKLNKGAARAGKQLKAFAVAFVGLQAAQAVKRVLVGTIQTFREFELTISKVRAISGATQKEMIGLEKTIRTLGRSTVFTAAQIGEAALNLSKLGFETEQIKGALPGVVSLAAASGEELAESAEIMAQTLRAFQKPASEAGAVADLMAKSFSSSSLNLLKFSEGMRTVAPVARGLDISLEETTSLLASLTDKGFTASTAGTSLRFALIDLATPTSKIAKALGGATLQTKTFTELLDLMREKGIDSTKAMELLGKKGGIGLASLLQTGSAAVNELTGKFSDNAGAAKRMADIMTDNLDGSLKLAQSAFADLAITLGKAVGPGIKSFVDLMTKAVGKVEKFTKVLLNLSEVTAIQQLEEDIKKAEEGLIRLEKVGTRFFVQGNALAGEQKKTSQATLDIRRDSIKAMKDQLAFQIKLAKFGGGPSRRARIDVGGILGGGPGEDIPKFKEAAKVSKKTNFLAIQLAEDKKLLIEQFKLEEQLSLDAITSQFDRERELEARNFDEKMNIAFGNKELERALETDHQRKLTEIGKKESEDRKDIKLNELNAVQQIGGQFIQAAATLASISKKNTGLQKAAAIAGIIFNTSLAVMKIIGDAGIAGIPAAIGVGVLGAAQLAKAVATKFSHGGVVGGFGSGDSQLALLEPRERVVSNREISGIGGIDRLEEFLRTTAAGGGSQSATLTVKEGGGAMGMLVRQLLPFLRIEMERA